MRLKNLFDIAITAILRNKTRSLLTSLGIIIGVASVILLVSIGEGLKSYINKSFESLGTNVLMVMPGKITGQGGPGMTVNKLTFDLVDEIENKAKYVKAVIPALNSTATVKYKNKTHSTQCAGMTANYAEAMNYQADIGRNFTDSENKRAAKVAVLGPTVVEKLFGEEDPIGKQVTILDKRFQVIGVTAPKGSAMGQDEDDNVIIPVNTLRSMLDVDTVQAIYIQTYPDENEIAQAKESVHAILIKNKLKEDQFSINTSQELLNTITGILSALTLGLGGIAAISLIVGGIGIMNIMLVSVTERTREIGLRKSVGAHPKDILVQFLFEAVVLSLVGGAIGIALGTLGSLALRSFLQTHVTLWSVLMSFGFSTAIGVIFGVWPARKASKLSPIDALRYE